MGSGNSLCPKSIGNQNMKIKKMSVPELQAQISILNDRIKTIQESCEHFNKTHTFGADTGNYFERNSYWRDYTCHTCLKKWRKYND